VTFIVPIPTASGGIRICGDFKEIVKQSLVIPQYPLPKIEDIFYKLEGGQKFSKIDLSSAFHHLEMDQDSQKLLTAVSHKGLYQHTRLLFGIVSAPALWQQTVDQILSDILGHCFLDDSFMTGVSDAEHLENLKVLLKMSEHGLKLNKRKCVFFQEQEHCGQKINAEGLHKSQKHIQIILEVPLPTNVTEVNAFCGFVQYYKFLPNIAQVLHPLYTLTKKNKRWK
jgi:hypothetical protein